MPHICGGEKRASDPLKLEVWVDMCDYLRAESGTKVPVNAKTLL